MRQTSRVWRIAATVAVMAGWLSVVPADEPPPAEPPSAFEQLFTQKQKKSSATKPRRKTVARQQPQAAQPPTMPAPVAEIPAWMAERISRAGLPAGNLPVRQIVPTSFTSNERIKGWKVKIDDLPLTTPAVADGKLFIGSGYGSRDFYALNAETGELLWRHDTVDNGPTAPVVDSGYISYSTESCTLDVLTLDGGRVWSKWLGPVLLTMPAIADGRVIASFPDNSSRKHFMASFLLKDGKEEWRTPLANEIIAAPVIDRQRVLVATADGTLYCLDAGNGKVTWIQEQQNATSTPTVWKDHCWFSRRCENAASGGRATAAQTERIARRGLDAHGIVQDLAVTSRPAKYLALGKNCDIFGNVGRVLASQRDTAGAASSDGVSTISPDASFSSAVSRVPSGRPANRALVGLWNYQGSRPLFYDGHLYAAMGDSLSCVAVDSEKTLWKQEHGPAKERNAPPKGRRLPVRNTFGPYAPRGLTQPALVNHKVFIGTSSGEVLCLSATTGDPLWKATVGSPVAGQPVVVRGRVYVTTMSGDLYCLNTGDPKDNGWAMWGGNAAHSGTAGDEEPKQANGNGESSRLARFSVGDGGNP
jgi:Ca-activated chloride channel homolog